MSEQTPKEGFITREALEAWGVRFPSDTEIACKKEKERAELRDLLAKDSPIGFEDAKRVWQSESDRGSRTTLMDRWAQLRYEYADAMLRARG